MGRTDSTFTIGNGGNILVLVTDGIHMVEGVKGANAYLVTGSQLFLIDTGLPGQEYRICHYLNNIGIEPTVLEGIILTHYDVDHVGSALKMQQIAKCPIYAHSIEIPYILGRVKRPGIKRWLPTATRPFYGKLNSPTELYSLSRELGDWEIIHTPGHTPGHIILYRNGIAIVGDLFQGGEIRLAPTYFTWDKDKLRASVQKVIERPLRWILPGHGPATPASSHWLDKLLTFCS
ncbi:MAG: MBL fold metallo-hydrolase [Bacillota bacterium]|nr:MBL fold metallo-hydrolase [Bacillota bacterium]